MVIIKFVGGFRMASDNEKIVPVGVGIDPRLETDVFFVPSETKFDNLKEKDVPYTQDGVVPTDGVSVSGVATGGTTGAMEVDVKNSVEGEAEKAREIEKLREIGRAHV